MRQSKYRRYVQAGWVTLLSALMLSLVVTPVSATSSRAVHAAQRLDNATSVGASTYITTGTLVPLFQNRIDQHVPGAFNNAINNLVSTLPRQDQGYQEYLKVKPDGTVMQGNTRIKVLQERGYNVDELPRFPADL